MNADRRRASGAEIVITGMGAVTALGEHPEALWAALAAGRSGVRHWRQMDERIYSKIGGDMADWDRAAHLQQHGGGCPPELVARARRLLRTTPQASRMSTMAAVQAVAGAGWPRPDPDRFGHVLAGHNLNCNYFAAGARVVAEEPED